MSDYYAATTEQLIKAETRIREQQALLDECERALSQIDALDPEDHVYGCSADALRGLVIQMGQTARATLAMLRAPQEKADKIE